jgi:hypothetical protein
MVLLPSHSKQPIASGSEETNEIYFSSVLNSRYYDALETLLFFNPQQRKFRNEVSEVVDRYGNPKIIKDGDRLRLQIGSSVDVQTLFWFDRPNDGDLIGTVIYSRDRVDRLAIIHLAVREDYSISGRNANKRLFLRFIQKILEIGARIKGVEFLEILYDRSHKKIPVCHILN